MSSISSERGKERYQTRAPKEKGALVAINRWGQGTCSKAVSRLKNSGSEPCSAIKQSVMQNALILNIQCSDSVNYEL